MGANKIMVTKSVLNLPKSSLKDWYIWKSIKEEKKENISGKMKIYNTLEILEDLERAINNKTPFSLIRFGDGGIKLIHAYFYNDNKQLDEIVEKEGIPLDKIKNLIDLWAISASTADYVDTPAVYFSRTFWPRVKGHKMMSEKTIDRLKMWRRIYQIANFDINKYCNPEINFLSCLNIFGERGFPNFLKDKKFCVISSRRDLHTVLKDYDFDSIHVPGFTLNQYRKFPQILNKIKEDAKKYDLWLVAAGELGRVYSGIIKFHGGISFDIGSTVDFWVTKEIPLRLNQYVGVDLEDDMRLTLIGKGIEYRDFI